MLMMYYVKNQPMLLIPISRIIFIILLQIVPLHLLFSCTTSTTASIIISQQPQITTNNHTPSCPPSSCGNITVIKFPFRLKTDPFSCGFNNSLFELDCLNNRTVMDASPGRYFGPYGINNNASYSHSHQTNLSSSSTAVVNAISTWYYYVEEINYYEHSIRLVDPGIIRGNLSSCPLHYYNKNVWPISLPVGLVSANIPVAFVHCLSPVMNSTKYVEAPFCGNRSKIVVADSSNIYSYVLVGETWVSDLEESCTMDRVDWVARHGPIKANHSSLASIYDGLAYGFIFTDSHRGQCRRTSSFRFMHFHIEYCCYVTPRDPTRDVFRCVSYSTEVTIGIYVAIVVVGFTILRFVIGFPLMIGFLVHKWQRRHLCMDKSIEEFLQGQCNLGPVRYTYSEIKKMTDDFKQKLGEGGYGTVYKGKLRSGPYVAIKMMKQSTASKEEFISEVQTIGKINHVNVVQLVGFCIERSNHALVYEFLPNGSLDRYIFNQQSLGVQGLTYEKMFEIARGVACGIDYLHRGCDMQILHFDIKPHNILLDEKFNPKISDFGLAQLHPAGESFISLIGARGTMGYMAPEMFYKNLGRGISHKADVYSYGMMLMDMASRRKNMMPSVDDDRSQIYFPVWVYDHLRAGNKIEIKDATEEEMEVMKKIIVVALWCIQIKPLNRPAMNMVVKMLESESQPQMPPKPFVAPREVAMDDRDCGMTTSYSIDFFSFDLAR